MRRWQWGPLPAMESECRLVAELLACKGLTGEAATKQAVMESARHAEIIHLATHVSWRLCGIVLSSSSSIICWSQHFIFCISHLVVW
jgi:CHAT domain-containing protein